MVNLTINGKAVSVEEGTTILDAAKMIGINIPTLCYFKDLNEIGACRVCVVELEGKDKLASSCNTVCEEGMVVKTNSPRVRTARRTNMQLILSQHDGHCPNCIRNGTCKLQKLAAAMSITDQPFFDQIPSAPWNKEAPLIRNESKCIKCMRCVQVCDKIQGIGIWDIVSTGGQTKIVASGSRDITDINCTYCGQCITHCPTGALSARDDTIRVMRALADPEITTIVQIAPAVRAAWGEEFGLDREKATVNRMAAALRRVGFDYIFDTNFAADMTIMEEGSEFIERFTHKENYKWPMFTSCCPGWVRFLKSEYPEFTDNLSTAKSPQQMFGAIAKSYFAEKTGKDPHKLFNISIMPCSSKKSECDLPTMKDACGDNDVDVVLTTRELNRILRSENISPADLEEEPLDSPLGTGTGAAVIFGATGGVMDAALRTAYYLVTGDKPDADAFRSVRGMDGWKEAVFSIPGAGDVRVAVVSGLANTAKVLNAIKSGKAEYDFVEVMACPGGCAGGGGQPIEDGSEKAEVRGNELWRLDKGMSVRYSHENPDVCKIYEEYFEKPLGHKSHKLLHTDHSAWEMPKPLQNL
ncbi:MAG: [FeFe] hydrogenase, group A [Clostridia bacterium]|nr:[FeFe] hydrogenase, group A [Clostridia bacterium]